MATSSASQSAKKASASSTLSHELELTIPWVDLGREYQKVLQRVAKRVKVDGFRAGKVPASIAEKMVDQPALYQQALENILPTQLQQLLTAQPVEFIGQPEIDPIEMEPGKDWKFTVRLAKIPVIKLGKYEPVVKKAATEEKSLQEKAAKELAKTAKKDDKTAADAAHDHDHAGHDHAHDHSHAPSQTELDDQRVRAILAALVDHTQIQIPEQLIRQEVNRDLKRLAEQLERVKMSVEQYLQVRKQSFEDLRTELSETAQRSWQIEFIMSALADERKLEATNADISEYLKKHNLKDISDESRDSLKGPLRRQKVVEWLLSA
jgi:FKBP-type peptidyl-prolyl cis-trans isomerase (trigger factor)